MPAATGLMRARDRRPLAARGPTCALAFAFFAEGCGSPVTTVILDNRYAPSPTTPLVVVAAYWQAVSFPVPISPGSSSAPQGTVPASANTAYVVLAPGWNPTSSIPPTSLVVLQSRIGFGVQLGDTLQIPVDDTTFIGHCASGSFLSQAQADFITELVFPSLFTTLAYDAATCTTTPVGDAGGS